jgi:hypothetical protein
VRLVGYLKKKAQTYFLHDYLVGVKTASRSRRLEVFKGSRPHRRSGRLSEEKKYLALARNQTWSRPALSQSLW